MCVLSNLVSLFLKFDVCSKHALIHIIIFKSFLMFTRHAQPTKNAFAAAYSTQITVYDVDECYDLVVPLDLEKLSHAVWNLFSFLCGVGKQSKFHIHKARLVAL